MLNLATGVASAPVTIGSGALGITDIAVAIARTLPALVGENMYATQVVGDNTNLISFDSRSPSFIRSLSTITGVAAGQTLLPGRSRPTCWSTLILNPPPTSCICSTWPRG